MRTIDEEKSAGAGWRRERGAPSLSEVHGSIQVAEGAPNWRKAAAFLGPGYLVAVGYMDPGNWATSIAGGSRFGYTLLFVVLLSSLMAMILQALAARLAIATGRDLAQACRDAYPAPVAAVLWLLAEIAICATDLAEVIGTAIGLKLLFGIPLEIGVIITALDVFLVLYLQTKGFRWVEALVITLLGVIAVSFLVQIVMADPVWGDLIGGFVPNPEIVNNPDMLYLALGIIGATVMPHNLYLHSGIVQTRAYHADDKGKREAIRFATFDSTLALLFALAINASILVLAASAFHAKGSTEVVELDKAYALLHPLLGSALAPTLFAVALLCCGLNSTVTATMAGQIVMEGFLNIRLAPWLRRLITRGIAIVPAAIVTIAYGESGAGQLLILSQVILSLQLPFAVVPLVMFTAERRKMGNFTAPRWLTAIAGIVATLIIVLNMKLIFDVMTGG
ncbi:Nramp family divalent metal transporter [Kaistia terrae]|jgi:manganese transport protein|uniref:Divalent metal cation transporter MntH n=1 Tax=Kaistia terrae TaxID=537017 RepID=A0ABW0Q1G6_9HYPH|nr:Nramp family divalent metal transporter [Kaistia terrae]MCX5579845.1 Nramp family divalent metal transporter [Kaistia terrae]